MVSHALCKRVKNIPKAFLSFCLGLQIPTPNCPSDEEYHSSHVSFPFVLFSSARKKCQLVALSLLVHIFLQSFSDLQHLNFFSFLCSVIDVTSSTVTDSNFRSSFGSADYDPAETKRLTDLSCLAFFAGDSREFYSAFSAARPSTKINELITKMTRVQ